MAVKGTRKESGAASEWRRALRKSGIPILPHQQGFGSLAKRRPRLDKRIQILLQVGDEYQRTVRFTRIVKQRGNYTSLRCLPRRRRGGYRSALAPVPGSLLPVHRDLPPDPQRRLH